MKFYALLFAHRQQSPLCDCEQHVNVNHEASFHTQKPALITQSQRMRGISVTLSARGRNESKRDYFFSRTTPGHGVEPTARNVRTYLQTSKAETQTTGSIFREYTAPWVCVAIGNTVSRGTVDSCVCSSHRITAVTMSVNTRTCVMHFECVSTCNTGASRRMRWFFGASLRAETKIALLQRSMNPTRGKLKETCRYRFSFWTR